jgi:hypothetical protein
MGYILDENGLNVLDEGNQDVLDEEPILIKNPTQWRPISGYGYILNNGGLDLVTNLGAFLTDNLGNYILTNPTSEIGKSQTAWTQSG